MREILFRGKRKDNGEWVVGYLLIGANGNPYIIPLEIARYVHSGDTCVGTFYLVDPSTVGQLTGLTDKNGKKIFEGDVVKFTDSPFGYSYTGAVCFNEGSFCIKYEYWKKEKFHRIGQTDKWQDMGASGVVTYQYEILGNIHDNPELLEKP